MDLKDPKNLILLSLLMAVRSTCAALMVAIDEYLEALKESKPTHSPDGKCLHPEERRRAAPRMTAPKAFVCTECNETVLHPEKDEAK